MSDIDLKELEQQVLAESKEADPDLADPPEDEAGEAGEAGEGDGTADPDPDAGGAAPDLEAKARRMGWKPKSEFRGDGFVDAEEFVRRGEEELPVLRERLRKQDTQIAEMGQTMKKLVTTQRRQIEKAVEQAVGALRTERRQAIEDGDADRVEEIDQQIEERRKELDDEPGEADDDDPADPAKGQEKPVVTEDMKAWYGRNAWFDQRQNPQAFALAVATFETAPGTDVDKLKAVDGEVRKRFPELFPRSARKASPVEGGNPPAGDAPKSGPRWADMPAEEREIADQLIKQKVFKDRREALAAWAGGEE
jgi:hypothetical protein